MTSAPSSLYYIVYFARLDLNIELDIDIFTYVVMSLLGLEDTYFINMRPIDMCKCGKIGTKSQNTLLHFTVF